MQKHSRRKAIVIGTLSAACLVTIMAKSANAADFYANKTLTILVGSSEASGFAAYSRIIAPYLRKYLAGNPVVIVKTMPGAGGGIAAQHVFQIAPNDGTLIATLTPNALMDRAFGRRSQIDPLQFQYIGGAQRAVRICLVAGNAPATTFKQAQTTKLLMGGTQAGSLNTDYVNMLVNAAEAKFENVLGYKGPGSLYLATERGEINGVCGLEWGAFLSQKGDQFRSGKLKVILQIGTTPVEQMSKLNIPQPWEFIKSKADQEAIRAMVAFQELLGKAYLAPPGVSAVRMRELRKAFVDSLKDPALQTQAAKMNLAIDIISSEEVTGAVAGLYEAPQSTINRLKDLVAERK